MASAWQVSTVIPPCVVAHQLREAAANLDGCVAVVGKRHDTARILTPHPDEVGDAMHQHAGLARARPGEHQHIGLLPVVRDDTPLRGTQLFYYGAPGIGRSLARNFGLTVGQPPLHERLLLHAEVVHREAHRIRHGIQAASGKLCHDVNLQYLFAIVYFQGFEIGINESSPAAASDGFL